MAYKFQIGAFTASGSIKAEEGFDANTQPLDNVSNLSNGGSAVEYNDAILMSGSNLIQFGGSNETLGIDAGTGDFLMSGSGVVMLQGDTLVMSAAVIDVQSPLSSSTYISASNIVLQDASSLINDGLQDVNGALAVSINDLGAELTGAIEDTDEFAISDGGTTKKVDFSIVRDQVFADVSGDATIAAGGALTIAANAVEGSMLNDNAISGQAEMTGDLADTDELMVSDAGVLKRADFSVVRDAVFNDVSGDATIAAGGALTIANLAVENGMLAGSIEASKMANAIFQDLESLGAASADGEFIVATGAGAFAYESGNTARTSLGLGTGDSPQFTGLTLTGDLLVQGSTTTIDSTTINISSSFTFEGPADDHETVLHAGTPTADSTVYLPTLSAGNYYLPALADAATDASAAVTAAEFALLDGGSTVSSATVVDGDAVLFNDGGTMKHLRVQDIATYVGNNLAETIQTLTATGTISLASGAQVLANSASPITLTLPAPGDLEGKMLKIKRIGDGLVTISANGSENIDGQAADIVLESAYAAVTVISDGSNYFIV